MSGADAIRTTSALAIHGGKPVREVPMHPGWLSARAR